MKRNYGIDLLRMVSMQMVVILHVLGHGGILHNLQPFGISYYSSYFLEVCCFGAINCFALTSGYVLYGRDAKISRLMELWLEIIFYMVSISLVCLLFFPSLVAPKTLLQTFFPITTNAYWYMSAYFGLYIFIPILNTVVDKLDRRTLSLTSIPIFIFMICLPAIFYTNPFSINNGYSMIWLMMMYVLGAYIKKYDIGHHISIKNGLLFYLLMSILTYIIGSVIVNIIYRTMGESRGWGIIMKYTSPTVLLGSVSLFLVFIKIRVPSKIISIISILSPACLGVYLLQDNALVRSNLMPYLIHPLIYCDSIWLVFTVLYISILMFLAFSVIDLLRISIFNLCHIKELCKNWGNYITNKIDQVITFAFR